MKLYKDVPCYACKFFPPKGINAFTWVNKIIVRGNEQDLIDLLLSPWEVKIINHEYIHIIQGNTLGWFTFYRLYLKYYFKGLVKFLNHKKAVHSIPFEMEAYANEDREYYTTFWEDYNIYG